MTKRRTQAQRTEESDNAMFKAAIDIISKDGPSNMTLAKVGKAAGFTGGLVSYRFGSKSGLLQAVSERILELWSAKILQDSKLAKSSGIERLKIVAEEYLTNVRKRSPLMTAQLRLMHASYGSCPDLLPYFQANDKDVRESIVFIISEDKHFSKDVDPIAFATVFIGTLRGVAQQYFINPKDVDLEQAKHMIWKICEEALKSSVGP